MEQQALREAFEEKKNRDTYLHNATERRQMLYDFINSKFFVQFMLVTIIVSICGIFLMTVNRSAIDMCSFIRCHQILLLFFLV